eukprot:TRINITY_DN4651_c0_g1_i1.p1 TRINITY_DN4651_c0_g1~~TRINITY_DN4651_c0_g1_i1.p1  ORF type:complete len:238 (+),score=62.61 TRINITY_DN4651_c0_g1_i1:31-714(+)
MQAAKHTVVKKHGIDLKQSSLALDDGDTVHFLVTDKKQPQFRRYCLGLPPIDEAVNVVETFRRYTDHTTGYCSTVNMSLASDSSSLSEHGHYIRQLRDCIVKSPIGDLGCGPCYRGVELSSLEMEQMEKLKTFFIPSFTSTSMNREKAYNKSALLVVKPCGTRYAASITPELSKFYESEEETLFACYTAFTLERAERVNRRHVLTLAVDDGFTLLDALARPRCDFES